MFAASDIFQIIFSGALVIGAGLLAIRRGMEAAQKLFCVFPSLVVSREMFCGYRIYEGAQVASTIMVSLLSPVPEPLSPASSSLDSAASA